MVKATQIFYQSSSMYLSTPSRSIKMGSHHQQVAALVQDENMCVSTINAGLFSKNQKSFIRDQCCHLADDGYSF